MIRSNSSSESLSGSNHKTAAAWNRGLAVRLLRKHESLSRRQISQMTGLRGSTLTYIVRELIEKDVVRAVGKQVSNRVGQKQVMLRINPDLGWVLGASLRPGMGRVVLLNAAGGRIDGKQIPIEGGLPELADRLADGIDQWLRQAGQPAGRLLGIGVGVPGVVDADHGAVLRSTLFNATNVPLQRLLSDRFGVPAVIDHDACFAAQAEAMDGAAKSSSHFLYFLVNHTTDGDRVRFNSYGSALYLAGKVYRGAHYGAGELGTTLAPALVETTIKGLSQLADASALIPDGLSTLAEQIGQVLASIINFIDLQTVVIGGTAGIRNQAFIDAVQREVNRTLIPIPGRVVNIVPTMIAAEAVAHGAAIAASDAVLVEGQMPGGLIING
ncbi:MAG TPA: ROK family protein [Tepidisphaeraceae bacterium]|nr:ROK family protein [Tepidisphaeraceae bacterium]